MNSSLSLTALDDALHYLSVSELKNICILLNLSCKNQKAGLIEQILHFLKFGSSPKKRLIPEKSKAQKSELYPLAPQTLILFGNYKNDLKTRLFMKELIGEHFHFTAFGHDWIKQRWFDANPPTYQEFAHFWQKEQTARQKKPGPLKREWAYLNFIQEYLNRFPKASRAEISKEWDKKRHLKVEEAKALLKEHIAKSAKSEKGNFQTLI